MCISCNNDKGYYFLNEKGSTSHELNEFIDCVNNDTKPINFYLNKDKKEYRECFQYCKTCNYGGNEAENNCTSCEKGYILEPDTPNSQQCVISCDYYYYYSKYYEYKCTAGPKCPDDFNLLIQEKRKCIDNCQKDNIYKYQYNGKCVEICPNETQKNDTDHFCKDIDLTSCKLTKDDYTYLKENITEDEIEIYAKKFAKEYSYTYNHLSVFENDILSIFIYKNNSCISELKLNPQVIYEKCYEEVKKIYNIDEELIIVLITNKKENNGSPRIDSYTMHEPKKGKLLRIDDICKDIPIEVQEDILKKIENTNADIESIKYLTGQNIDVFNISSIFYTDICFHFNSPIDKDIALKDRISLYYPNITLCENGCNIKGVNLTSLKAICDCKLNNLLKNNFLQNNAIYRSSLGEV